MIYKQIHYGIDPQARSPVHNGFYWPQSDQKRRELLSVKRNHPDVYESVYQCRPGTRIGSIFLETDFVYYLPPSGLEIGVIDPEVRKFLDKFHMIVAGWDTAFEAQTTSNYTVGIVAGFLPCSEFHRGEDMLLLGECEPHLDVYLLDVFRGKVPWGDLTTEFRKIHRKWRTNLHVVEKRGAGISLYQSMPTIGIMVEGVDVKENKRARAIEGVEAGSTQGWFRQHRIYFPFGATWLDTLKIELKDFTGDDTGTDDQVDALVHLVNYAIQIGNNVFLLPSEWTPENVDAVMEVTPIPTTPMLPQEFSSSMISWLQMVPGLHEQPFDETCSFCQNNHNGFCVVQSRNVANFDSCYEFAPRGELMNG